MATGRVSAAVDFGISRGGIHRGSAYPPMKPGTTHPVTRGGHTVQERWDAGEMGCGRLMFAATYLVTGFCASGLFWAIYPNSVIPLVGASGSIAGLMGAFAVLYGRKQVKIFYSLGFYFNYRTVPAIILLPFWVGQEFYQLFFGGMSNVAT